jgi:hypothetical protein
LRDEGTAQRPKPPLPIQVRTIVSFPNVDGTYHNLFSYSNPKRFDPGCGHFAAEQPTERF